MKGILTRNNEGIWMVRWSDLHSFGHGTHWMFTELSPDSNSIHFIKDGEVRYKTLEEGLEVEFEMVTSGYDENNFTPFRYVKLIFPDVYEFQKEEWIKEYVIKGNILFSIDGISRMRDGGTIMLFNRGMKQKPFYIHKNNWTLHNDYPTTDENIVTDKATQTYLLDRLNRYKIDCEFNLDEVESIIKEIKI
jgi:hypothetical protein